jgi:hypothetical protein
VIAEGKGARAERIELWFQDEMRVGQKTLITRRRAKRGTRPAAPRDQRTQSASVFGAIGPAKGKKIRWAATQWGSASRPFLSSRVSASGRRRRFFAIGPGTGRVTWCTSAERNAGCETLLP